jgi:hypothetical protein
MRRTIIAFMALLTMVGLIIPPATADTIPARLEVQCAVGGSIGLAALSLTAVPPQNQAFIKTLIITSTDPINCPTASVKFSATAWGSTHITTRVQIGGGPIETLTTTPTDYAVLQNPGSHSTRFWVNVGSLTPVGSYIQTVTVTIV